MRGRDPIRVIAGNLLTQVEPFTPFARPASGGDANFPHDLTGPQFRYLSVLYNPWLKVDTHDLDLKGHGLPVTGRTSRAGSGSCQVSAHRRSPAREPSRRGLRRSKRRRPRRLQAFCHTAPAPHPGSPVRAPAERLDTHQVWPHAGAGESVVARFAAWGGEERQQGLHPVLLLSTTRGPR